MKRFTIFLATLCLMLTSCITEDTPHNTPEGNFDYLWKILDEHYCFFSEKNKVFKKKNKTFSLKEQELFKI